jgi:TonB family protein
MRMPSSAATEIFSVTDIARAAGVSLDDARMLVDAAEVAPVHGYVRAQDAVRCVRLLRLSPVRHTDLFAPPPAGERSPGPALAASGGLHFAIALVIAFLSWGVAATQQLPERLDPTRLVFLATPGPGGGTGGGPYRPGSGITPPQLLREVRPDYTEDARRQGIEGDVVLEIVVRDDGSVGDVKILRGLGAGLDRRAVDAVRQWRFSPARRFGTPVDVMVEVAVEFKLR